MEKGSWEHFSHEADIGVRGRGATLEEAFEQAARALTAVITTEEVALKEEIQVTCRAASPEGLLVEWLNELVFQMATRNMLFGRFQVSLDDRQLAARVWGEAVDGAKHHPAVEIKGATFTELKVESQPGGRWLVQCVVDV